MSSYFALTCWYKRANRFHVFMCFLLSYLFLFIVLPVAAQRWLLVMDALSTACLHPNSPNQVNTQLNIYYLFCYHFVRPKNLASQPGLSSERWSKSLHQIFSVSKKLTYSNKISIGSKKKSPCTM